MTAPLVTLVTTARHAAKTLPEALASVWGQRAAPPFEYLLVDDGSGDETRAIMREAAAARPGIVRTLFFDPPGVGRYEALRAAHEMARGEFVGWLDADDALEPDCLAASAQALRGNPEAGFAATWRWLWQPNGRLEDDPDNYEPLTLESLRRGFWCVHFRLHRASAVEAVGGIDPAWPATQDYDLVLRLAARFPIAEVRRRLYRWRQRSRGSMSRAMSGQQRLATRRARAASLGRAVG